MAGTAMKLRTGVQDGLTLVEILVVVLIIALLAALALPSYHRYVERGHRADAVRKLLQIAGCQERVRAGTGYYDTSRCASGLDTAHYRFRIEPPDEPASMVFTTIASPTGEQHGNDCGSLSLDQSGTRRIGGKHERLASCWGGR
jgi:type IV pilus assembly protein PilE